MIDYNVNQAGVWCRTASHTVPPTSASGGSGKASSQATWRPVIRLLWKTCRAKLFTLTLITLFLIGNSNQQTNPDTTEMSQAKIAI
jgi:hypothetical protein